MKNLIKRGQEDLKHVFQDPDLHFITVVLTLSVLMTTAFIIIVVREILTP